MKRFKFILLLMVLLIGCNTEPDLSTFEFAGTHALIAHQASFDGTDILQFIEFPEDFIGSTITFNPEGTYEVDLIHRDYFEFTGSKSISGNKIIGTFSTTDEYERFEKNFLVFDDPFFGTLMTFSKTGNEITFSTGGLTLYNPRVFNEFGRQFGKRHALLANSEAGLVQGRIIGEKYSYYRDFLNKTDELRSLCPVSPNPEYLTDCETKDPISSFAEKYIQTFDETFTNNDVGFLDGFNELTGTTNSLGETDANTIFNLFGNEYKGYIEYLYTFEVFEN